MTLWLIRRSSVQDLRVLSGMVLPVTAGLLIYGWRAAGTMLLIIAGALLAKTVLSSLDTWPIALDRYALATQAALLSLFCPPTWCDPDVGAFGYNARWPLALAAGMTLTLSTWAIGRIGTARASPIVVTLLLILVALAPQLRNDRVLQRNHLLVGNLLDRQMSYRPTYSAEPWITAEIKPGVTTFTAAPTADALDTFLHGRLSLDRPALTIPRLLSDDLPPLEDMVIGGHPGPIGGASLIVVFIGGLFLVHRRVVAFRVPVVMLSFCYLMLLVLPTPLVVTSTETIRAWLAAADDSLGPAAGLTFANYLLVSSPALLVTFFIACQPGVRPMGGRAASVFAVVFGVACGASIMLVSVQYGPILAVAAVQLLTPTLERRLPQRPTI